MRVANNFKSDKNLRLIEHISKNLKVNGVMVWIQKLTFSQIFYMWLLIIFIFGLTYHFCDTDNSYLLSTSNYEKINTFSDSLYYSFVASTTTGFGDIVPFGFFKYITIIEVIPGLLLIALVTSKIVSIKQDVILNEIYEISLSEIVNKLRTSLLLFRRNLSNLIVDLEDDVMKKTRVNDLENYLSGFDDLLDEIHFFILKSRPNSYVKKLDFVDLEMLLGSSINSLEKIDSLIVHFDEYNSRWGKTKNSQLIKSSISKVENTISIVHTSSNMLSFPINDILLRFEKVKTSLSDKLA